MRILVLCYEYPPLGGGGGRAARHVGEELAKRGHDVRVQTAGMRHLPARERINDVEISRAESFRRREERCTVPEMALYLITSFLPALRHIRQWRPDVIHAHFAVPTGALAFALNLLTRTPYVLTVQLGDVPGGVPEQTDGLFRVLKPFTVPIWKRAAAITVVSEFVKDLALRAYGLPVVKIANGIDLSGRADAPSPISTPPHLVAIGRLNPQKNFLFLIDALAAASTLDWRFTLIGDGDQMAEIQKRIAAHGLADRITLPGWLEGSEVQRMLATGDVFLMPSLSEGLPVAGLEALKHGLAILGSDIGGLHDLVDQSVNGRLLPLGDPVAFGTALREMLSDSAALLEMKRASYRKACEFDLALIAAAYEEVLATVAKKSRG